MSSVVSLNDEPFSLDRFVFVQKNWKVKELRLMFNIKMELSQKRIKTNETVRTHSEAQKRRDCLTLYSSTVLI